jgi:hypothetical protein
LTPAIGEIDGLPALVVLERMRDRREYRPRVAEIEEALRSR